MSRGQPYRQPRRATLFATATAFLLAALAGACGSTSVEHVAGPTGSRCAASLSADPTTAPPDGTTVSISVSAARDCAWSARSDVSWMQLRSSSGQGDGTFTATVARNDLPSPRSGGIFVNDQRLGITQEGRGCTFTISGPADPVAPSGGRTAVSVATLAGCTWTATSSAPWLAVLTSSGSGSSTIVIDVQTNPGPAREASVTVGGRSVTIVQSAAPNATPCTYTIAPPALDYTIAGGQGDVGVTTGADCAWTVDGGSAWITIVTAGGTGPGTARYTVAPNPATTARTATLTIGGRVHTVTQAGVTCTFTLTPVSRTFTAAAGSGTVQVDTLAGCAWTASSTAGWANVGATSGVGPGTVPYTVLANPDSTSRTASIRISGQTHTITQEGVAPACTYTLDPASRSVTAAAQAATVHVDTAASCAWAASSNVAWIVVAQGNGTGPADVSYSIAENVTTSPRTGVITLAGQTHTVTQAAAAPPACTYTLTPAERTFGTAGGAGTVHVTTGPSCAWTAVSNAAWVTVSTPNGSGPFDIAYQVAAGAAGVDRTATITIGDQVHTVRQTSTPPPSP